uniref:Uncharacterized protein n=1 Tax=Nymphaea colorata TaxID=210225 RepID=A0A5K1EGX8_9MAGN
MVQAGSGSPSPEAEDSPSPSPPAPCRHLDAMEHASSFVITSHSPSLARIRHSSPLALSVTVISGVEITYGFR